HLYMRNKHVAISFGTVFRERVDGSYASLRNGIRVVITIDLAHVRLPAFEIEPLHLVQLSLDEVDRLWVQRRRSAREIGLADHSGLARRVDHDEIVGRDRS